MSKVEVEVGTRTSGFKAGLAQLGAQADQFKSKLARKFSFSDLGKGVMQGLGIFGATQVADKIVEPWRQAADYAKDIADESERATAAVKAGIAARNADAPERQQVALDNDARRKGSELEGAQAQRASAEGGGAVTPVLQALGPLGQLAALLKGVMIDTPDKYLAGKKVAELTVELTQAANASEALSRQTQKQNERLADQKSALLDQRRVKRGEMTELQASLAQEMRLQERFNEALSANGPGVTTKGIELDLLAQQDKTAAIRNSTAGLKGISADSLARVGGGGGVFGGGNGVQRELQTHTTLLKQIVSNTSQSGGSTSFTFTR